MARLARAVVAGVPHHVTQRGNRRQPTFFEAGDYAAYKALLAAHCRERKVAVWAWCLMPNHVHLVLVPSDADGLARALGEAHRRYSTAINRREGWTGYLWQGRFASCALDESHLLAAARYIELNPVRAGLVARPADWPWSSAAAHLTRTPDGLTALDPLLERVGSWRTFLDLPPDSDEEDRLRLHLRTGRPLGDPTFVADLERRLGRPLQPRKRGPKPKTEHDPARPPPLEKRPPREPRRAATTRGRMRSPA